MNVTSIQLFSGPKRINNLCFEMIFIARRISWRVSVLLHQRVRACKTYLRWLLVVRTKRSTRPPSPWVFCKPVNIVTRRVVRCAVLCAFPLRTSSEEAVLTASSRVDVSQITLDNLPLIRGPGALSLPPSVRVHPRVPWNLMVTPFGCLINIALLGISGNWLQMLYYHSLNIPL